MQSTTDTDPTINYLAPEVFTGGTYDAKSDIWALGCILFELCTQKQAFSAETAINLIPKITSGNFEHLPSHYSLEVCELLSDLLNTNPEERPTASEILMRPTIIGCLKNKCQTTVENLETKLEKLRALADGLERVHEGTTVGSLAGGVIGAVGGITSIVGIILAPFTLGASLIVTGVGVGVGAVGGVTAGASNITNMVNQTADRKAVRSIIREFEQKIGAVVSWLMEINNSLQIISSQCPQTEDNFTEENLKKIGLRAGRGIGGITELFRLLRVVNIGKIAAQTSRAVRVAEVATGVLSGLFVAVDIFFIAMDAKEIHHIKEAREAERRNYRVFTTESTAVDTVSTSDQVTLLPNTLMQKSDLGKSEVKLQGQKANPPKAGTRSELMKFVHSVREAAQNLEPVLGELSKIISSIPLFQVDNALECQNTE